MSMDAQFLGVAVLALTAIMVLLGHFIKLWITPVNDLTVSVTKLNSTLDKIVSDTTKLEGKVESHDERLDGIDVKLARHNLE